MDLDSLMTFEGVNITNFHQYFITNCYMICISDDTNYVMKPCIFCLSLNTLFVVFRNYKKAWMYKSIFCPHDRNQIAFLSKYTKASHIYSWLRKISHGIKFISRTCSGINEMVSWQTNCIVAWGSDWLVFGHSSGLFLQKWHYFTLC